MKRTKVRRSGRRGFTLIELLIVLAILVGLMALVAPRIFKSRGKAEINTAKSQIGLFESALENYELDVRSKPATEQGLAALVQAPAASSEMDGGAAATTGWDGPYLSSDSIPKDPWGMDYQYEYPSTRGGGSKPDIWSFGPDRQDGTEDDICSWGAATSGGVDEDGNPIDQPMEPGMDPMDPMDPGGMPMPEPPGGMPPPPALPPAGGGGMAPPPPPGPPAGGNP